MALFLLRRFILILPTVLGVITTVFLSALVIPGDPVRVIVGFEVSEEEVQSIRESWGLNQPIYVQYGKYLLHLARGDLGRSLLTRRPVWEEVRLRLPISLSLATGAMTVALALGIPLGIFTGLRPNSAIDTTWMVVSLVALALPVFWLGLILILVFSVRLGWLPSVGTGGLRHLILPSVTLGLGVGAVLSRHARAAITETSTKDFVRTAFAKGLSRRQIIYKHILKNSLIPIVTVTGLYFGLLIGGAVLTETVFGLEGLGKFLVDAVLARDYPAVRGSILVLCLAFSLINLVVDATYGYIDPRIRHEGI